MAAVAVVLMVFSSWELDAVRGYLLQQINVEKSGVFPDGRQQKPGELTELSGTQMAHLTPMEIANGAIEAGEEPGCRRVRCGRGLCGDQDAGGIGR